MKTKRLNGIYTYSGFDVPALIGTNIDGIINNVIITDNYMGDQSDIFIDDFKETLKLAGVDFDANTKDITAQQADEITEQSSYFGIYVNPTYEQLNEFNKSVGLDPDTYIDELFQ